jgi:DNA repair protein RadC
MSDNKTKESVNESAVHRGHRSRMRERMKKEELASFAPHEIIETMLYYVIPRGDTNPMAHALIERFGSVRCVLDASVDDLLKVKGVTQKAAYYLASLPSYFEFYRMDKFSKRESFNTSIDAANYFISKLAYKRNEEIHLLFLDKKNQIIESRCMQKGTIDKANVFIRDISEVAIRLGAVNAIMSHNHPSGKLEPSESDVITTKLVFEALALIDVFLQDHIIVGQEDFYSFFRNDFITACKTDFRRNKNMAVSEDRIFWKE